MAVEAKRGCGYRKQGGLYMVSGGEMVACDRLPFELNVCPCCGGGIKQARGWTWITPLDLFEGDHPTVSYYLNRITGCDQKMASYGCECLTRNPNCPVCFPSEVFSHFDEYLDPKTEEQIDVLNGKAGLIWIGKIHYETPADFMKEGAALGISRRINSIPKDFKLGETWVFLAHPKAVSKMEPVEPGIEAIIVEEEEVFYPGIFTAFFPTKLERIVKQSDYDLYFEIQEWMDREEESDALKGWQDPGEIKKAVRHDAEMFFITKMETYDKMKRDHDRGITFVPVPDDDKDHQ